MEGALPFDTEEGYTEWFVHCFGSGRYKCICTEKGVTGAIAMCKFSVEDSQYPPRVNPKELVQGHPENKGFIDTLKMSRMMPYDDGDVPEGLDENDEEEDEEMITAEVLRTQSEQTERLTNKLVDIAEKKGAGPDPHLTMVSEMGGMYKDAAHEVVEMVTKNAGPQLNVLEVMKAAKEMDTSLRRSDGGYPYGCRDPPGDKRAHGGHYGTVAPAGSRACQNADRSGSIGSSGRPAQR